MSTTPSPMMRASYRAGFRHGIATVVGFPMRDKPPVHVKRSTGSLTEDARALQRDAERLFDDKRGS